MVGRTDRPVRAATLNPDGRTLACLVDEWIPSSAGGADQYRIEASLWGVPDGRPRGRQQFEAGDSSQGTDRHSISFRLDGKRVVFTGSFPEFYLWNPGDGGAARRLPAGGVAP